MIGNPAQLDWSLHPVLDSLSTAHPDEFGLVLLGPRILSGSCGAGIIQIKRILRPKNRSAAMAPAYCEPLLEDAPLPCEGSRSGAEMIERLYTPKSVNWAVHPKPLKAGTDLRNPKTRYPKECRARRFGCRASQSQRVPHKTCNNAQLSSAGYRDSD